MNLLPSDDAAAAQQALQKALEAEKGNVLFNVTSGNKMMMFAVSNVLHDLSKEKGTKLKCIMIYRDIDKRKTMDFTAITYCESGFAKLATLAPPQTLNGSLLGLLNMPGHDETKLCEELNRAQKGGL